MNEYLVFILVIIIGSLIVDAIVDLLNLSHLQTHLPKEFSDVYDSEKYEKSQNYLKTSTHFGLFRKGITTPVLIAFILAGGFNWADTIARSFQLDSILTGLVFVGIIGLLGKLMQLPFSIYDTFAIEEKFGFNKTTPKTFLFDQFKGLLLSILIGAPIFAGIVWFFQSTGTYAWLYAWIAITVFQLLIVFLAPIFILPLFNKFTPLEDGNLKTAIESYAKDQNFVLSGIFKMDGSRRSTKSNAFFTGFGKFRRIVLFDTLIERHSIEELVSILAHEIGHYKKRHILKSIFLSIILMGFMFYFLSLFINNESLFAAFGMESVSVYASIVFIGFLYSPFSRVISIFSNTLSRKYEFEADEFAKKTYGRAETLVKALKKLSVDNLSNLTPHPWKVFLEYTHPPVMDRIEAIRK